MSVQDAIHSRGELETITVIKQEIKDLLEHKKAQIHGEIAHYPPPIPACDQHFNYLLEQRAAVAGELRQLAALSAEGRADHVKLMDEFVATSPCLDDVTKQKIRAALSQVPLNPEG